MERVDEFLKLIAERAHKDSSAQACELAMESEEQDSTKRTDAIDLEAQNETDPSADGASQRADVAILTALREERGRVLEAFAGATTWTKEVRSGAEFDVGTVQSGESRLRIVVAQQNSMGMVPAAILTMKTLTSWRPCLVVMCGICAGVRGKANLGDVVVAKHLFDYGSGKLVGGNVLVPDYEPIPVDDDLCGYAEALACDKAWLRGVKDAWAGAHPDTELQIQVGAMASGSAVVANDAVVHDIQQHKRSLTAIDMEGFGVARAVTSALQPRVPFLVAKGVQDYADDFKDDRYREFAAYASAQFVREFLERYWKHMSH